MNQIFKLTLIAVLVLLFVAAAWQAKSILISKESKHIRSGTEREFSSFPKQTTSNHFYSEFDATENESEYTLLVTQNHVRNQWIVTINGKKLGKLETHEGKLISHYVIPSKTLKDGTNAITIKSKNNKYSDDIFLGTIEIVPSTFDELTQTSRVKVTVTENKKQSIPVRLTITDKETGALVPLGIINSSKYAYRTGVLYTADGKAEFRMPPGNYKITASRGFEYSIDSAEFKIKNAEQKSIDLNIIREVPTPGLVAADTHVHTRTYSGHGDCRVEERVVTIAGEGIELAVATDHNHHADYEPFAKEAATREYFTPVVGNEYTTKIGHVNIFPVDPTNKPANPNVKDWSEIMSEIRKQGTVKATILNHPLNIHNEFQPFGKEHLHPTSGEQLDGWPIEFDGIEVVVSAALQSDYDQLYHNWFSLLNRGIRVSPLGSSDSHDVDRYILGQGRTYVRCDDSDPSSIDVEAAAKSIREGRVYVSMGLLAELIVNEKFLPGDTIQPTGELEVTAKIRGPSWVKADRIRLFQSGLLVKDEELKTDTQSRSQSDPSLIAIRKWTLPTPRHDTYLVLQASGPGIDEPFWRTPLPYQKSSPHFEPRLIGSTGAIWIDADRDGKVQSAYDYATAIEKSNKNDFAACLDQLGNHTSPVSIQFASIWQAKHKNLYSDRNNELLGKERLAHELLTKQLGKAKPHVREAIASYIHYLQIANAARIKAGLPEYERQTVPNSNSQFDR